MAVEEEYEDVLQNIESGIIQIYKENPDLIDAEVTTATRSLSQNLWCRSTREID